MRPILEIKNLKIDFNLQNRTLAAVDGVNLHIRENETLVLAGESGSGKTITALSITKLLPPNAKVASGKITFNARDLLTLDELSLIKIRGGEISYIFQEPSSFLDPVYSIGSQISEAIMLHQNKNKKEARREALALLRQVQIKQTERVFVSYPHQLSGGMNQRVFIAMSLACRPKLLIADEPTTSLDVTTEEAILDLLMALKKDIGFSLFFITHNLSVAKKIADRIYIMHKGKIVEEGGNQDIFNSPKNFYTLELIKAYKKIQGAAPVK